MLTRLLHLKHWQLFLMIYLLPVLFWTMTVASGFIYNKDHFIDVVTPFLIIAITGIYFGWLYVVGTQLHQRLPPIIQMNVKRFKLFVFIPAIYGICISVYAAAGFKLSELSIIDLPIMIPLHLFSVFCQLYCLYFVAKALQSVEWQHKVTFNNFFGIMLLLWLMPVGVWFLQPRINKLFANHKKADLFV